MNYRKILALCLSASAFAACAQGVKDDLTTFLNARISGSVRVYESSARALAEIATMSNTTQSVLARFVLAAVSMEPDAPKSARLSPETRALYLAQTRNRILALAQKEDSPNPLAMYLLYLEGGKFARSNLERAAKGDNVQALNELGSMLLAESLKWKPTEERTQKRQRDCFGYFSRAAVNKNDPNGLYNAGVCHLNGWGAKKDIAVALDYLQKAAEQDQPRALEILGELYRDGKGVDRDLVMSTKYFSRSSGLGFPKGMFEYANALLAGSGIEKNERRAVSLLKSAAESGLVDAMDGYAKCLYDAVGVKPFTTNGLSGVALAKALDQNAAAVSNRLHTAVSIWYHCATKRKFRPSMDNLATAFLEGKGVPRNERAAVGWYTEAAKNDYVPAMRHLADCHDLGVGGLKANHYNANWWRTKANAVAGDRNAWVWLSSHELQQ